MSEQNWIEWCQKQFSDVARALSTQGYTPDVIETLTREDQTFADCFNSFQADTAQIMNAMAENPGGYHHYEAFHQAKRAFLTFTNTMRGSLPEAALCA